MRRPLLTWLWVSVALFAGRLAAGPADAPKIRGESQRAVARLAAAEQLELQRRWPEAIDAYLQLIDDSNDDLVPFQGQAHQLISVRGYVHRRLSGNSKLLKIYRERVEAQARRLLDAGERRRDLRLLEQIVDRYFCSESAKSALHLLGDLACERGDYQQAIDYWRRLAPAAHSGDLVYPGPLSGEPLIHAKMIVARLLAGERAEASAAIESFERRFAEAKGHLAGQDGNLSEILQSLLRSASTLQILPNPITASRQPNCNGSHHDMIPMPLPAFHSKLSLTSLPFSDAQFRQRETASIGVRPVDLNTEPVIAFGQAFVSDLGGVAAFDVRTGALTGRYRHHNPIGHAPMHRGVRQALAIDGDRIYACFRTDASGDGLQELICLRWRPEQESPDARLQKVWRLSAKEEGAAQAEWCGTPIVCRGRLFMAKSQTENSRTVATVNCFDAINPTSGPQWTQAIVETQPVQNAAGGFGLTLAGRHLVFCSQAGSIVALDAASGRRAWAFRYPPQAHSHSRAVLSLRPTPSPAYAEGRIVIAPTDADRVYCLNAESGALLWSSGPIEVSQVFGVVHGRAICAMAGRHSGICAFDAMTGRVIPDWGYRVAGSDSMAPFGNGLLCRDRIYWPTRSAGIQELRWNGTLAYPSTILREVPGGNLAFGDGCLAVATPTSLQLLTSNRQLLQGSERNREVR